MLESHARAARRFDFSWPAQMKIKAHVIQETELSQNTGRDGQDQWVLWDVDDVVTETSPEIYRAMLKMTGRDLPWEQWQHHDFVESYGIGVERIPEMIDIWHQEKILEKSKVYEGVKAAMDALVADGYKVGMITARGWHVRGREVTEDMINEERLPVSRLIVLQYVDSKAETIKNSGLLVRGFIDDTTRHALGCSQLGIPSVLRSQPWNADALDLLHLDNVRDFPQFIRSANSGLGHVTRSSAQAVAQVSPLEAAMQASTPRRKGPSR